MQAGGIGYGKLDQAIKRNHKKVIKLSFLVENYRIGMGELPFHLQIQELWFRN
jgi:hypothetical protein